jgi:hypoxanthine phosphoribosyltransferase
MKDKEPTVLFDSVAIAARIKEMAGKIEEDYPKGNLLLIGILKGAFMFLADLSRHLSKPCEIDFARISSYGSDTVSSGELKMVMDIGISVKDRDVILVDDIVDSGLTLSEFRKRIERDGPRSVKTAAMIDKTARRDKHVYLDYCGFRIEDGFVVGYGLDCDEQFRNLKDLCVLK